MSDTMSGVYKIISKKTGKFYIGSSEDLRKRKKGHLTALQKNRHHNAKLQAIYNRHGVDDLRFVVVKLIQNRSRAYALEDRLIKASGSDKKLLNIGLGARGGDNLSLNPRRKEIVARIADSVHERMSSMTAKEKKAVFGRVGSSNGMWGKTHDEDTRRKISQANSGKSRNKGVPKSAEHRAALSASAKGRTGEKNGFYGRSHSDETKAVLSAANKGKLPPNTRKVRIGKKVYVSATEAGRQLGVVTATILHRINSKNYPEYSYKD